MGLFDSSSIEQAKQKLNMEREATRAQEAAASAAAEAKRNAVDSKYAELAREFIAHAEAIGMKPNTFDGILDHDEHFQVRRDYRLVRVGLLRWKRVSEPRYHEKWPVWTGSMTDHDDPRWIHTFRVWAPDHLKYERFTTPEGGGVIRTSGGGLENVKIIHAMMLRTFADYEQRNQ
jgi:hypothetical protein